MDLIGVLILDLSAPSDPSGPFRPKQTPSDPLEPKLAFWACREAVGDGKPSL